MATERFGDTVFYYVTDDISYPDLPSEVCASAKQSARWLSGLTAEGYEILFDMMIEIEGVVRGGYDRWFGFSAAKFNKAQLDTIRDLVRRELRIERFVAFDDGKSTFVVYFLSPAVVA